MKWTKLTLHTTTQAADLAGEMLAELGIDGVEIEDNRPLLLQEQQKMFIDLPPELPPDDGTARVSFYVEEGTSLEEVIASVQAELARLDAFVDTGEKRITVSETQDSDWIDRWKQYFKPFRVDDTLVVKPTWENFTDRKDDDIVVEIDPGMAFGTGSHETTKLCMLALKKRVHSGVRVLDVGCGSGILSITARLLGASFVVGTDIDEGAVSVAKENTEQNGLACAAGLAAPGTDAEADLDVFAAAAAGCGYFCCNVLKEEQARKLLGDTYQIVVANILAEVILPLSDVVGEFLAPGGIFISSGILDTKAEVVREALERNGLTVLEENRMGDWVSFTAQK